MTTSDVVQPGASAAQLHGVGSRGQPVNLGDILERVLDKGLVIAGDIQINLLDIELLTIKLRLVIASLETAREVGINWWESDPWLNANAANRSRDDELDGSRDQELDAPRDRELEDENRRLRERIEELESGGNGRRESGRSSRG
jgi:hypothetical protein